MKLSSLFLSGVLAREHFHGDKVFRFQVTNERELSLFDSLVEDYDLWKEPRFVGDHADIHIPLQDVDRFEMKLIANRVSYNVMIPDLEAAVEDTYNGAAPAYTTYDDFSYEKYHRYDDYQQWQKDFAAANSDLVSIDTYGTSFEGRDMNSMKIGTGSKKIVLHGGTHAREWISPITMINLAKQLVDEFRAGGANAVYLSDITWYITINQNPDGYEYTWTDQRMWRKTRNTGTPTQCDGVDPNRNWDAHWATVGSSSSPCSDTYHGVSAFSEVEMRSASEYMTSLGSIQGYADVHAYSQYWMFPYGYQREKVQNYDAMDLMSKDITDAIFAVHRTRFVYGSIYDVIYPAAGSSCDWVYDVLDVPCSFAPELRDRGQYGFLLPEDQIKAVSEEMWAGFTKWGDNVIAGKCDSK